MTTEQGGVSPATAGGAGAPDFNAIRDALVDTFRGVPLWQLRQGLIAAGLIPADVEIQAAERKPVDGGPGIEAEWDEDADAMRIDGIGWDLSFGCKVSFALDHDKDEYYVCVSTSDADQRAGITSRRTTKEELASLGQQLVNVFGEPDPRDAEIERMRKEYDEVLVSGVLRETLDAEIERLRRDLITEQDEHLAAKALLTEAREEWKRGNAEIEKLRKRLVYDLGPSGGQWSGQSVMELLQRLKAMYTTALDEARSRNGDMRAEIEELERQRDYVLRCHSRVAASRKGAREERDDYAHRLRETDKAYAEVAAERDRLRAELDLIGEQQPKFRPGQMVRIGIGKYEGIVVKPKDVTRVQLTGSLYVGDFPTMALVAVPADEVVDADG